MESGRDSTGAAEPGTMSGMVPPFAAAVLDVVDEVPVGRVVTYGDIAAHLGVRSARQVGQVMARFGHEVAWHRVVLATGACAAPHGAEQLARLRAEGVALRGGRVDLRSARFALGVDGAGRAPSRAAVRTRRARRPSPPPAAG